MLGAPLIVEIKPTIVLAEDLVLALCEFCRLLNSWSNLSN